MIIIDLIICGSASPGIPVFLDFVYILVPKTETEGQRFLLPLPPDGSREPRSLAKGGGRGPWERPRGLATAGSAGAACFQTAVPGFQSKPRSTDLLPKSQRGFRIVQRNRARSGHANAVRLGAFKDVKRNLEAPLWGRTGPRNGLSQDASPSATGLQLLPALRPPLSAERLGPCGPWCLRSLGQQDFPNTR